MAAPKPTTPPPSPSLADFFSFLTGLQNPNTSTLRPPVPVVPAPPPPTEGGVPPPATAPPGPVSGGDMADVFAQDIAQRAAASEARTQLQRDLLFGRHLGVGGAPVTPANPTGNPSNPWAPGGFFAGNPTNRAAQAIQAQPLWMQGAGGELVHGTNYPAAVPAAPVTPLPPVAPPLPLPQQVRPQRYVPPAGAFASY